MFSQLLFACYCFPIISQEMQTTAQVQKYKRNMYKEIKVVRELSYIQPEATNQPILHRSLFAHGSVIQDSVPFLVLPEREGWDSYIKRISNLYEGFLFALLQIRACSYNTDEDMSQYPTLNKSYGQLLIYPSLTIL